jgi:hypothetical protein
MIFFSIFDNFIRRTSMPHTSANPEKASAKSRAKSRSKSATHQHDIGDEMDREEMISVAAYYRAEHRGFGGGDPLADWLAAEAEIDAMLNNRKDVKIH